MTEKDGKASEYKTYEEEAISNVDDYVDVYPIIGPGHSGIRNGEAFI